MRLAGCLLIKQVKRGIRRVVLTAYHLVEGEGCIGIPSELTFKRRLIEEYGLRGKHLENRSLVVNLKPRELKEIHVDRLRENDLILDSLKLNKEEIVEYRPEFDSYRIDYHPSYDPSTRDYSYAAARETCMAHFLSANLVPEFVFGNHRKPCIPELSDCFFDLTLKISEEEYRQLREQGENSKKYHVFSLGFKLG